MSVMRASVRSTLSDVRVAIASSKLGRLDGLAYQYPPPSYWSRAMVMRSPSGSVEARRDAARPKPNDAAAANRTKARRRIGMRAHDTWGKTGTLLRLVRQPVRRVAGQPVLLHQCARHVARARPALPQRARPLACGPFIR